MAIFASSKRSKSESIARKKKIMQILFIYALTLTHFKLYNNDNNNIADVHHIISIMSRPRPFNAGHDLYLNSFVETQLNGCCCCNAATE